MNIPFEAFAPLSELPFIYHAFTLRTTEDTKVHDYERRVLTTLGLPPDRFVAAQQTHGNAVAVFAEPTGARAPTVDALATSCRNLSLVIRCADCAGIFVVDRATPAIALVHSGKRGTLANVVGNTVARMKETFGTDPRQCVAVISPSIGPCHYEMDIWSAVEGQLREAGVLRVHNPRVCTACQIDRYFSYRAERGHTGRMFAVLALRSHLSAVGV